MISLTILTPIAAPPHTRGWTHGKMAKHHAQAGSPAHAGMDPVDWVRPRELEGLPRTRGDGPPVRAGRGEGLRAPPLEMASRKGTPVAT